MHPIRLGPPWVVTRTAAGLTRHARKFGAPRLPDPGERVWLVCEAVPGPAEVTVNGTPVGTADPGTAFAADVTTLLRPRNEVAVEGAGDGPLGPVRLEVRPGPG